MPAEISPKNQHLPNISRLVGLLTLGITGLVLFSCSQTTHPVHLTLVQPATIDNAGLPARFAWTQFLDKLADPGPIVFEKHLAANWEVDLGGMLNLEHPRAQAAQLKNVPVPIQIFFYLVEHPQRGDYMIDSGIARSIAQQAVNQPILWPVSALLPHESLAVKLDTKSYLATRSRPLAGVWLTHLHLDHILGLEDIPKTTPLFTGAGEAADQRFSHFVTRRTTDANLLGFGALHEWPLESDPNAPFDYVDIFGDQSVMGLHVPGHTQGNMAFVVRSTNGPILLTGDACHTAWGWNNGVEPGTFNTDGGQAANSLYRLKRFANAYPSITVHLGHQTL